MIKVIKRDGRKVNFDWSRITDAILRAYCDVYKETNNYPSYCIEIAKNIEEVAHECDDVLTVEDIQDLVEDQLMEYDRMVAKTYIKYRYKRGVLRSSSNEFIRSISKKIMAADVQNQNANVDEFSFGGRVGEASDEMMRQYALDFCLSPMARENHLGNMIYIHDLSAYAIGDHNCLTIPFDDLLAKGFNTRQTDVRPANSINTAFQLFAVIFQLQSLMQYGGVSSSHLDWTMVPYVRKSFFKHYKDGVRYLEERELDYSFHSDLSIEESDYKVYSPKAYKYAMEQTEKELQQAIEGMYHNLSIWAA